MTAISSHLPPLDDFGNCRKRRIRVVRHSMLVKQSKAADLPVEESGEIKWTLVQKNERRPDKRRALRSAHSLVELFSLLPRRTEHDRFPIIVRQKVPFVQVTLCS